MIIEGFINPFKIFLYITKNFILKKTEREEK